MDEIKRRRRLTPSNFSAAMGMSRFKTPDKLASQILKKCPDDPINENMKHGIIMEPTIIKLYTKYTGNEVLKPYYKIPDYDRRLAGIPDGLIGDNGLIETKCAKKMYFNLYKDECMSNPREYIFPNHFYQMIGYMEIFDKEWIEYTVFSESENLLKIIRIYRDKEHWNEFVYPSLVKFMEDKLGWMNDDDF
uniref:YqaJ-like recombinase n=1 Tax=Pithovirus LCPAC403 TaxID=2506596 RepID=A0A481ZCW2_9VIRU|nr:MAG: YqaJ-like recombinase [Pithovirus LCPAC403]